MCNKCVKTGNGKAVRDTIFGGHTTRSPVVSKVVKAQQGFI